MSLSDGWDRNPPKRFTSRNHVVFTFVPITWPFIVDPCIEILDFQSSTVKSLPIFTTPFVGLRIDQYGTFLFYHWVNSSLSTFLDSLWGVPCVPQERLTCRCRVSPPHIKTYLSNINPRVKWMSEISVLCHVRNNFYIWILGNFQ